jgi:hypothetical protein
MCGGDAQGVIKQQPEEPIRGKYDIDRTDVAELDPDGPYLINRIVS